jgi:hypothetical protein
MVDAASDRAGDFQAARTRAGVDVFVLPTRKFKTKLLSVHWRTASSRRNAARALVPNLMRRGTRRHPSMADVSRAFESLYGSSWSSSVYKHGQAQITSLRLETVEERFLPGKPAIFAPAVALMRELLFEPHLVRGAFPEDVNYGAHVLSAGAQFIAGNTAMVVFGSATHNAARWGVFSWVSVCLGVVGLVATGAFAQGYGLGLGVGGLERVAAYTLPVWLIAAGVLLVRQSVTAAPPN